MAIKLGSIVISLEANTVSFSDSMSKMSQLTLTTGRNVERSLKLIGTAATAMAASVTASLIAATTEAEEFAHTVAKAAQATGTSSEMMSKLAYSARLAGLPLDDVKMSLEKLARTSSAAQNGNKDAVAAYAALGLSVRDLQGPLKDSGDLFVAVAKKMDAFSESTAKTGLEQKLLGRSGAEMAPLLKQIASGFDTASRQATLFGVVVGDKTAEQAERLHQSMTELESIMLGFSLRLLTGVAPALSDVSGKMIGFATSGNGMKVVEQIASDVSAAIHGLGSAFEFLTAHVTAVKRTLEGIAALQVASIFVPMISGAASAGIALDTVGLVAIKMIGRLSGISALIPVIKMATSAIELQAFMMIGLIREEGILSAANYALTASWKTLNAAMLANPYALIAAGLGMVGYGLYGMSHAVLQSEVDGGRWSDIWNGFILGIGNNVEWLTAKWKNLRNEQLSDKDRTALARGWNGESTVQLVQDAGRKRRGVSDDLWRMIHAPDISVSPSPTAKLNAPAVPKEQADKVDHLKLKMDELAAAAASAHESLLDAGKGLDLQRADAIAQEYTKTIIELEAALKAQHKTLSDADKAALLNSITNRVNDESQANYLNELVRTTEGILSQASAQDILTQAIGRGAYATRAAAIAANAAKRDASQSEEWKRKNAVARAADDVAFGMQYDAANGNADKLSLKSVQDQINAQLILNGAIGQGARAQQAAALANEQDAIRKRYSDRGETNQSALDAELAANERLFQLKQAEANLSRAASMDPAKVYRDQAEALEDAANAAKAAGIAISDMEIHAVQKANWQQYLESVDKTTLAVGSASQGAHLFFEQMARDSVSAAQQVHDVLGGAFESLNDTLVRVIDGQRINLASFFSGIAAQIAKLGLEKLESGIASSVTNKKSGTANSVSSIVSLVPGLGPLAGLFGGHFAGGGNVTAGVPIDVGEMGRETFTPTQDGRITPNSQLPKGGFSPTIHVYGNSDPAQVRAQVMQGIQEAAPHLIAASVRAHGEHNARRPSSSSS